MGSALKGLARASENHIVYCENWSGKWQYANIALTGKGCDRGAQSGTCCLFSGAGQDAVRQLRLADQQDLDAEGLGATSQRFVGSGEGDAAGARDREMETIEAAQRRLELADPILGQAKVVPLEG